MTVASMTNTMVAKSVASGRFWDSQGALTLRLSSPSVSVSVRGRRKMWGLREINKYDCTISPNVTADPGAVSLQASTYVYDDSHCSE